MTNVEQFPEQATLYTVDEASEILKVHPDNLRAYLRAGTIEGIKIGRVWRVTQRAILDFIERSVYKPEAAEVKE